VRRTRVRRFGRFSARTKPVYDPGVGIRAKRNLRGDTDLGALAIGVGLVLSMYFGILLVPLYLDNLEVERELGITILNFTGRSDGEIKRIVATKLSTLGWHYEDEQGFEEAPGILVSPDEVIVTRLPDNGLNLSVAYAREVRLKPFSYILTLEFDAEREGSP
jgi:hypothetical protein